MPQAVHPTAPGRHKRTVQQVRPRWGQGRSQRPRDGAGMRYLSPPAMVALVKAIEVMLGIE